MKKTACLLSAMLISISMVSCGSNNSIISPSKSSSNISASIEQSQTIESVQEQSQVPSQVLSSQQSQAGKLSAIAPKYDDVRDFSEGLAAVCINDKWGYIDKTGKVVVPIKYDFVGASGSVQDGFQNGDFSCGLAMVKMNGKYGFIDKTGKEVVPLKYDNEYTFCEGMAAVCLNDKWGFIDITGKEIVPLKYDSVSYFQDGMAAVSNGGEYYHFFDEEMGEMSGYNGSKWGFIDTSGKEVVSCQYNFYSTFYDGVAIINTGTDENQGNHYGIIDKTGKVIVPVGKYTWFGDISEGMIAASVGEYPNAKWGFIDVSGKEVIPCIYNFTFQGIIPSFSEGLTWCGCGLMDKDGNFLLDATRYDDIWFFHEGMAWVQLNNKYGFIDSKGNEVITPKYGYVRDFKEGLAAVCLNKSQHSEWGYIDKTGKEITPCKYSGAESFNEGYAAVSVGSNDNEKWGFINQAGTLVVECQYQEVNGFEEGMAAVCLNDKWGFISFSN